MDVIGTPRRTKRPSALDRKAITERRKSLFGVGGVSPLSSPERVPSDEERRCASPSWSSDETPSKKERGRRSASRTPKKSQQTPVKLLQNDFTQMALITRTPENKLDRPVIEPCTPQSATKTRLLGATSARRSPRLLGVRELSPDRGLITPKMFYGRKAELFREVQSDGKALYRRIRESVRIRLPMETIPREKKRARSSGSGPNSAKRPKKIPRHRLFNEDETPRSSKKQSNRTPKRNSETNEDVEDLLQEITDLKASSKNNTVKRKSTVDKPTYNWQFFNTKTPPASKMSRMFGEKSPSVLTPPPTIRKRKLISSYDHLTEKVNDENSSLEANKQSTKPPRKELGLVDGILEDFSEDENEEDLLTSEQSSVDKLLENLNRDVAEVLGDDVVQKDVEEANSAVATCEQKLYPIFNLSETTNKPDSAERTPMAPLTQKRQKLDPNQLVLDVGQSGLREIECSECGLLYVKGYDTDEEFHRKHHNKSTVLTFPNWKSARCIHISTKGERVILIKSGDPAGWWNKAQSVLEVVDFELGFPPGVPAPSQVYLCLQKQEVVGCLAAGPLRSANRVLPDLGLDTELCTEEEFPVRVGVSRIWVCRRYRRQGVARLLLDKLRIWVSRRYRRQGVARLLLNKLRRNYMFGEILKLEDIAFSSPTEDGKKLAINYFGREDFLIYSFSNTY